VSPPSREELATLDDALEGKSPEEILRAVSARFPGRIALANSFGAEDCVLVDVVGRSGVAVEVFTLDTGYLFQETIDLWRRLEERYGLTFRAARSDLPPVDPALPPPWESDPDACCEARKLVPLRSTLAGLDAWVTGIRRDQTPDRASARVVEWDGRFGLVKVNPLAAWTSEDVWAHLRRFGVPTNPLHAQGYSSIGCAPCTSIVAPGEDPRAGRWRGRAKTECGLHARPAPSPSGQPPRS
jgi:phosphoadenylyl-sulfate reductase (thioredoxin)